MLELGQTFTGLQGQAPKPTIQSARRYVRTPLRFGSWCLKFTNQRISGATYYLICEFMLALLRRLAYK